jgi:hypothetical protein
MDESGYPTEQELEYIRTFDVINNDWEELMQYIQDNCWYWGERFFYNNGNEWKCITGGWSGNESVIMALKENTMFWMLYWKQSNRGGFYRFENVNQYAHRLMDEPEPPKEDE